MGDSEELPRVKAETGGAPKLDIWDVLVSLVLNPWGMACPTLVCLGIWARFDPF